MRLLWRIEARDIERARQVVAEQSEAPIVRARWARNLAEEAPRPNRAVVWRALVGCLLATRQRSGSAHPVTRFLRARPFPLDYERLLAASDPYPAVLQALRTCGGLGRSRGLADHLADNCERLRDGGWRELEHRWDTLRRRSSRESEKRVSDWLDETLSGFGPRESRRLLLALGLSRHELPLDADLLRWLNRLPVTPRLAAAALAERGYYRLALDGVQQLSAEAGVFPVILDASIRAASGLPEDDATCW